MEFPSTRRGTEDRPHHGTVCLTLLGVQPRGCAGQHRHGIHPGLLYYHVTYQLAQSQCQGQTRRQPLHQHEQRDQQWRGFASGIPDSELFTSLSFYYSVMLEAFFSDTIMWVCYHKHPE